MKHLHAENETAGMEGIETALNLSGIPAVTSLHASTRKQRTPERSPQMMLDGASAWLQICARRTAGEMLMQQ